MNIRVLTLLLLVLATTTACVTVVPPQEKEPIPFLEKPKVFHAGFEGSK